MSRRLPPLNPLRAFESAARHDSFARAADELSVTPAAISRQVKLLERYFGVSFFDRNPSGVHLTPEARSYAAGLTRAFDQIGSATDEFRTRHTSSILTIRGYTTFLVRWLVPKLPDFQSQHPHVKVRLASGTSLSDAAREEADIAIRYGHGEWPGYRSLLLFHDELVPVCSPRLLKGSGARRGRLSPARIAGMPLLSLEQRRHDWADWFALAGLPPARDQLQSFEDLAVLFEFARRGMGIALAQRRYVEDELAVGTLVVVSDLLLRRPLGYWAITRTELAGKSKVAAFLAWLERQRGPLPEPPPVARTAATSTAVAHTAAASAAAASAALQADKK